MDIKEIDQMVVFFMMQGKYSEDEQKLFTNTVRECIKNNAKIEISVDGYNEDPRDLWEIAEVKAYLKKMFGACHELISYAKANKQLGNNFLALYLWSMCDVNIMTKESNQKGFFVFDKRTGRSVN